MIEGLWIVLYEGTGGGVGGVVVFIKGKVLGGDTAYTYIGSYQLQDKTFRATVTVRNFLPDIPNVTGVVGNFELNLEGKLEGNTIRASGSVVSAHAIGVALKLTKQADLPV